VTTLNTSEILSLQQSVKHYFYLPHHEVPLIAAKYVP